MVRLKVDLDANKLDKNAAFQFHDGTIKRLSLPEWNMLYTYFNSTMVRLKAVWISKKIY